jgi:hypothetical protein
MDTQWHSLDAFKQGYTDAPVLSIKLYHVWPNAGLKDHL